MSIPTPPIAVMRKQFTGAELSETASEADPVRQFARWISEAQEAQAADALAMSVSTVGAGMRPSSRMVHMKSFDERGIVWFTNYESRKGLELAAHPFGALLFHWGELERMVRIEGRMEKTSDAESDASFATRPLDYRIGTWASPQSQVISSMGVVVANAARVSARFLMKPPRPPHWGGYRLVPEQWEFWQGRKSKLQDRVRYSAGGADWLRERLAP